MTDKEEPWSPVNYRITAKHLSRALLDIRDELRKRDPVDPLLARVEQACHWTVHP